MNRYVLLFAFLLLGTHLFAQYPPYYKRKKGRNFHPHSNVNIVGQIGIAAGQEHFISAPKGGVFLDTGGEYPRHLKMRNLDWDSFSDVGFHAGPQLSMFILFGGWFSYGVQGGISVKPFTFDVSITRTTILNPDSDVVGRDNTINPKLGIFVGPVWVQCGPSFAMNGKGENLNNIIRLNGQPFNFELSYIVEL
ncbi:MAG: hypothetical protein NXI10_06630 [bacterium]|nr:hypothetical protein [bacterium]